MIGLTAAALACGTCRNDCLNTGVQLKAEQRVWFYRAMCAGVDMPRAIFFFCCAGTVAKLGCMAKARQERSAAHPQQGAHKRQASVKGIRRQSVTRVVCALFWQAPMSGKKDTIKRVAVRQRMPQRLVVTYP